ncbi:MAG: NAD-dependent epimerase/dehydratase family protein [Nitrospirae bacterium]|nr:NAD-dependent epimerase/dehydratase family protein [Nitrospirota bacterium]
MLNWEGKNIFITGADGFIGAWLAKRFVEKKANVVILIRDIKGEAAYKLFNLEGKIIQVQGDLRDQALLERVLNEYSIDSCFHLAAQALVQIATRSPLSTFASNIEGTWKFLEACRNTETIERVVVASSDKAYGGQKELPYTEESPLLGLYPYDASKACADILARSYFVSYGLPVAVTRNANTYGGGDLNFSRIIPDAMRCILQEKKFVIRSDGTPERDYMYVEDAVDGYITLAGQIEKEDVKGGAFNFGTGRPISVLDLFKTIARLCGRPDVEPEILGQAKNEIDRQYLAIDKAKERLEWVPRYTLEEGLKQTIAWYRNYLRV